MIIVSSGFLITISSASSSSCSQSISIFGTISTGSPSNYDFVFQTNGSGWYEATWPNGSVAYASTNASYVFNSALALGHNFLTLPGNYYLTSPILLNSNTVFVGSGIDSTNFEVAANVSTTMWYFNGIDYLTGLFDSMAGHNSNITLKGFTINGNTPTYQIGAGIWLENVDYFTLENVALNNIYGEGIIANQENCSVYSNTNYVINNVETYGCGLMGGLNLCDTITLQSISDFSITNTLVDVTGDAGIIVTNHPGGVDSTNGVVDNCQVYGSQNGNGTGQAGNWNFLFQHCQNVTVENCYSDVGYYENLGVAYCSNCIIQNFTSANSGAWGMLFYDDNNITANGLVSYNSGQIQPTGGLGIGIQDCSNCTFLNSQSYSNSLNGWLLTTATLGCVNNQFLNCTGINNAGDGIALYNYGTETICNDMTINGGIYSGNTYGIDIRINVTNTLIENVSYGTGNSGANLFQPSY